MNPEILLMHSRASLECNQKSVIAELHAMYCQKAYKVGMTLDGYCNRFGITKVWEVHNGNNMGAGN